VAFDTAQAATNHIAAENAEYKAVLAALKAGASLDAAGPSIVQSRGGVGPGIIQVTASAEDVIKGYAKIVDPKAKGIFYRDNLEPVIAKMGSRPFSEALAAAMPALSKNVEIQAANSLGTLSGTLVAQRSLGLLKLRFPILSRITRDFSNQSAQFNQSIMTRVRAIPAVSTYVPGTGFVATAATDTDVPVAMSSHVYSQITYNANELASTARDLFGEQAEGCSYAIGKYVVDAIYALITPTNFSLGAQKTVQAVAGFNRVTAQAMCKAMNLRGIGPDARTILLNPDYYMQLGQDASVVAYDQFNGGNLICNNVLPSVGGFTPVEAVNLPTASNLVGFGLSPDALIVAARVPSDYTQAQSGSNYGTVSTVSDPDTGLSTMLTQYVDHNGGTSNYRVSLMFGTAVGNTVVGQLLTSA
jgi:hypothetical protein